jgi:VWFA-related protein
MSGGANCHKEALSTGRAKKEMLGFRAAKGRAFMRQRRAWAVIPALFILGAALGTAVPDAQDRPQEQVTVTAVEIPVRVLLNGEPVKGLTKDDFDVYEDGVRQSITGFEIISRRISAPAAEPAQPEAPQSRKRVFLLVLNIFDYTDPVGNAIDYLYKEVFKPGDQVLVVIESRIQNADRQGTAEQAAGALKESLKQFKSVSTGRTIKVFQDLRYEADRLIGALQGTELEPDTWQALFLFFDNYRFALQEYSNQYLKVDLKFYENLVKRIQGLEGERWAIFLQQREMFPMIRDLSRLDVLIRSFLADQVDPEKQVQARLVQTAWDQLKTDMALSGAVAPEELRDVFMRGGMTFHLILMSSQQTLDDEDLSLKEVGQDYEEGLRQISRATGGLLEFNNRPLVALRQAAEREDYHYVLVYQAKNNDPNAKRELKVKVRREGVEVISLKNYLPAAAPLPPPLVSEFKAENGMISFKISRCRMTGGRNRNQGQAEVQITILDARGTSVFEEKKTIGMDKKEKTIRINLSGGPSGEYEVVIRVVDLLTNQSASLSGKLII